MAEKLDPNDRVTRDEHTPAHWPLAPSLWVAYQQQLAQLKARNAALLQAWEAEDRLRQRDALVKLPTQLPQIDI